MDRPYEAINGTVRPASFFLKEDCGLEFVVAEISYGEFIRKFIKKSIFFHSFQLVDNKGNRKVSPFRFYMAN